MMDSDKAIVRYLMIWINADTENFSGLLYGYVWGWTYASEYRIHGKSPEDIDEDMADREDDEKEAMLEEAYSWIINSIYSEIEKIFDYDYENFRYSLKKDSKIEFDRIWEDYYFLEIKNPIDFGNTYFTK